MHFNENKDKLPNISPWNTSNILLMDDMFSGCSDLIALPDISVRDLSSVKNISFIFNGFTLLISLPQLEK